MIKYLKITKFFIDKGYNPELSAGFMTAKAYGIAMGESMPKNLDKQSKIDILEAVNKIKSED